MIVFLFNLGIIRYFITLFFNFEGMLLAMRGCTCVFRGCSRTLKTPNSPPLPLDASLETPHRAIGVMLNFQNVGAVATTTKVPTVSGL